MNSGASGRGDFKTIFTFFEYHVRNHQTTNEEKRTYSENGRRYCFFNWSKGGEAFIQDRDTTRKKALIEFERHPDINEKWIVRNEKTKEVFNILAIYDDNEYITKCEIEKNDALYNNQILA